MLYDSTNFDDLPKYDKYDDDYVVKSEVDSSSQSSTCFQNFKEDNQLTHVVYGKPNGIILLLTFTCFVTQWDRIYSYHTSFTII